MDTTEGTAEQAVYRVVAELAGPIERAKLIAAAAAHYQGPARHPAQAISAHLRFRQDLVPIRKGWFERLDRIMDGTHFRLTLTPEFIAEPWVPPLFFNGYVGRRRPIAQVVDERTGAPLPEGIYTELRESSPQPRGLRVPALDEVDLDEVESWSPRMLVNAILGGGMPGPWRGILGWGAYYRDVTWLSFQPLLKRARARPGDALVFQVEAALEDRLSVAFRRADRRQQALLEERNRELADRLARFVGGERHQVPAHEAVPIAYSELAWGRDAQCPAEHWWIVAEGDPRLRSVDGQAIAEATLWRREDEHTGRPLPERPDASQAGHEEARKEYLFKVSLGWSPSIWRTIALRGDQTLADLHDAIQGAFRWDNDHLYAFFLNNRAWDDSAAYYDPRSEDDDAYANGAAIGALNLRKNRPFLYIFDFGDELRHEVRLMGASEVSARKKNPRIVERHGRSPRQYAEDEGW